MANPWFQFKQFIVQQDRSAMKVTTDGCLFGAWVAERVGSSESGAGKMLDIGTGTGLLALMLAQKNPAMIIDAIEIDPETANQAKENVEASPWKNRINIINTDARTFISPVKYACIISNPPFYEKELKSDNTKKNIAHHGDELPLTGLLQAIKENLTPDGVFFLLLPFKRDAEIRSLLLENDCHIKEIVFVRQSTGHDYFRIMLAAAFITTTGREAIIDEIAIKDRQQQYTPAFITLLKDYYLHL